VAAAADDSGSGGAAPVRRCASRLSTFASKSFARARLLPARRFLGVLGRPPRADKFGTYVATSPNRFFPPGFGTKQRGDCARF